MQFFQQYMAADAANDARKEAKSFRTKPIANTTFCVPGYPSKLMIFKFPASQFWQIRCSMGNRTHIKTARTTNQRVALNAARDFYNWLCAKYYKDDVTQSHAEQTKNKEPAHLTFAAMAAQMYASEQARVDRGERVSRILCKRGEC